MSDATPLPRMGEVFFDDRGEDRALRLSWHPDADVMVLSIWNRGVCSGTFRLMGRDAPTLIATLSEAIGSNRSAGGPPAPEPVDPLDTRRPLPPSAGEPAYGAPEPASYGQRAPQPDPLGYRGGAEAPAHAGVSQGNPYESYGQPDYTQDYKQDYQQDYQPDPLAASYNQGGQGPQGGPSGGNPYGYESTPPGRPGNAPWAMTGQHDVGGHGGGADPLEVLKSLGANQQRPPEPGPPQRQPERPPVPPQQQRAPQHQVPRQRPPRPPQRRPEPHSPRAGEYRTP